MEARLSRQLLHIVELDKAGDLTPQIQHRLSETLDAFHLQEQHRGAGGPTGLPTSPSLLGGVSNAGLGRFINAGPKVRAPKVSFPKLSAAPKIPGLKI
jgi:hypothetical protein